MVCPQILASTLVGSLIVSFHVCQIHMVLERERGALKDVLAAARKAVDDLKVSLIKAQGPWKTQNICGCLTGWTVKYVRVCGTLQRFP